MMKDFDFWSADGDNYYEASAGKDKAQQIADLVMPFLENLANKKNDADTIKWPAKQRHAEVQAVIDQIESIIQRK